DTQPTPRSNEQNDHANLSESTKPVYAFPNGVVYAREESHPRGCSAERRSITITVSVRHHCVRSAAERPDAFSGGAGVV
ncbi:hypothetical protein, partial [Streptomyces mirabilis]|uniref:hypothetical protein n=1 Tax=Streptomyces mirabilis TaxID=68239 RepID=UPI0033AAABEA